MDLILLVASVVDLRAGATTGAAHGLAATYLGSRPASGRPRCRGPISGSRTRFAGGPPPQRAPRYGRARAPHEWKLWLRAVAGWAVACGLLALAIVAVGDDARTAQLLGWINGVHAGLIVGGLAWPLE